MSMLPEDPAERKSFDRTVKISFEGKPLLAIAQALTMLHKMAPSNGSYGKMLAIYANECAKAAQKRKTT